MELHKPVILTDGGPWAEHDHACSVCHVEKAVLRLDGYTFLPCWKCQEMGWQTPHAPLLFKIIRMLGLYK